MVVNIDFYRLIDKIDALIKNYGSLSIYRTVFRCRFFSIEHVGLITPVVSDIHLSRDMRYSLIVSYVECFQAYFRR